MPTLKNNTETVQKYIVKDQSLFSFEPGEERVVPYYSSNANLTVVADLPYYNRLAAVEVVSGLTGTAQLVDIHDDAEEILVMQITGETTVFLQAAANTPAHFLAWTADNPTIPIPSDATFNKLAFTGSGACTVYQYK